MRTFTKKLDIDTLNAYRWKKPDTLDVEIKKDDNGTYFARIKNYKDDNVVTQAETGKELVEMVNELLYDYLEIPIPYRIHLGYFLPPEEDRDNFGLEIPAKYLGQTIDLKAVA